MSSASPEVLEYAPPATTAAPRAARRDDAVLRAIAFAASVVFVFISITATVPTYRFNFAFLIPLMWAPYALRRRLFLRAAPYAMFGLAIALHDVGGYGLYQHSPLPFSWDILVHYYFAIPVTLILYGAIAGNHPALRGWRAALVALLFMMGFGALHEIMEYGTYLLLGEEKGMLKPRTSHFFDTQRDLTNNLLGTLTGLLLLTVAGLATARFAVAPRSAAAAASQQRDAS